MNLLTWFLLSNVKVRSKIKSDQFNIWFTKRCDPLNRSLTGTGQLQIVKHFG